MFIYPAVGATLSFTCGQVSVHDFVVVVAVVVVVVNIYFLYALFLCSTINLNTF